MEWKSLMIAAQLPRYNGDLVKRNSIKSKEYFARAYPPIKDELNGPEDRDRLRRIKDLGGI